MTGWAATMSGTIAKALLVYAGGVAIAGAANNGEVRHAVWANAAAVAGLALLERVFTRGVPERLVSLVRVELWLAALPSIVLSAMVIIQGEAVYSTARGQWSHVDGAWGVTGANLALHLAIVVGARACSRQRASPPRSWRALLEGFGPLFLLCASVVGAAVLCARVALVFVYDALPSASVYVLRLFVAYYTAILFLIGVSARRGQVLGRWVACASVPTMGLVVLTGSRGDGLIPLVLLGLGWLAGARTEPRRVVRLSAAAAALLAFGMYVGDAVRDDRRGRTGHAAIERVGELSDVIGAQATRESVLQSTLGRFVSNSTHSVITRIPREMPHERDGLARLPGEFLERLLPRFNLTGTSPTELPRHWMLNDLGFLVNWSTSVELSLLADAWYRGGWWGIVLIGLLAGILLQGVEDVSYLAAERRPEYAAVVLFVLPGLYFFAIRDVITGTRNTIFTVIAGVSVAWAARALGQSRIEALPQRIPRRRETRS